jgi:AcrR family transcriptional regulator
MRSSRLAAANRKEAILEAAAPVFARLGRAGATTKDLAKAANISEALLYRHFSGKDALYAELERHCMDANKLGSYLLENQAPSTATLVTGVALLVQAVFPGIGSRQAHDDTKRLITSSLLNDGTFAKAFLAQHVERWIALFEVSLVAARQSGDIEDGVRTSSVELWFVHHLASTMHLTSLPSEKIVDYGIGEEELTVDTVRFLLRGLGLKNAAIQKYYEPTMFKQLFKQTGQS